MRSPLLLGCLEVSLACIVVVAKSQLGLGHGRVILSELASLHCMIGEVRSRPRIRSHNKLHFVLLGFAYRTTMRLVLNFAKSERRLFLLLNAAIMRIYCVSLSFFRHYIILQDSAKRWFPGCVKAAGKARQKW